MYKTCIFTCCNKKFDRINDYNVRQKIGYSFRTSVSIKLLTHKSLDHYKTLTYIYLNQIFVNTYFSLMV